MRIADLQNVSKSYGETGSPGEIEVLGGVDFVLEKGEAVAVVGPSGCGKSTLLNILGTLDLATGGEVSLFGQQVSGLGDAELAVLRARHIGFVFQMHHLLPQCSVLENVLVPTMALPAGEGGDEARARALLERVGLDHRLNHLPGQLSGGECQRAAVVRALINSPELLLADEPTGALDTGNAANLSELIAGLNREEGVAVVLVSHDRALADKMQKVYTFRERKLEQS